MVLSCSKLRTPREPPSAPLPFEESSLRWPCTRTSRFLKALEPGHLLAAPRSPSGVPPPPSPPPSNGLRFRIRSAPQSDEDRDGSVPSPHRVDPDADDAYHGGVDVDAAVDDDDAEEEKEEILGILGKPKARQKERRRPSNNGPAGACDDGPEILKPGVAHGTATAVESNRRTLRPRGKEGKGRQKAKAVEFRPSLSWEEVEEDFLAATGTKPPRRSRRRPRAAYALAPGSFLPKVVSDLV